MAQSENDLTVLANHVREALPDSKAILNLKIQPQLGVVSFYWHGAEFLVKPNLQVLELRGNNVYITGLSSLLQLILARKNQRARIVESVLARINQVEDMIQSQEQPASVVRVLDSVKDTLLKMVA